MPSIIYDKVLYIIIFEILKCFKNPLRSSGHENLLQCLYIAYFAAEFGTFFHQSDDSACPYIFPLVFLVKSVIEYPLAVHFLMHGSSSLQLAMGTAELPANTQGPGMTWSPFYKCFMSSESNFCKNCFCHNFMLNHHISLQFCTCHGSWAAHACAKIVNWYDHYITGYRNTCFLEIWIMSS